MKDLNKFIIAEIKKYVGNYPITQIVHKYNRMTIEELAQEVYIKVLKAPEELVNKSYIRKAVMFVCIDEYRKFREVGPEEAEELEVSEGEVFGLTERLMQLDKFDSRELTIILLLMEGKRNPEIRKELGIPKMSYYTILGRIKDKYNDLNSPKDLI